MNENPCLECQHDLSWHDQDGYCMIETTILEGSIRCTCAGLELMP